MRTRIAVWCFLLALALTYRIGRADATQEAAERVGEGYVRGFAQGVKHGRELQDAVVRRALRRAGVQVVASATQLEAP